MRKDHNTVLLSENGFPLPHLFLKFTMNNDLKIRKSESDALALHNQRVLITGGAGAIGSTLVQRLAPNNNVVVIDNLSSGRRINISNTNCRLIAADIRDSEKLRALFNEEPFDTVIHLAAHFANQNSIEFPETDLRVNIEGTQKLLELCKDTKPRVVYASSSCVYGSKTGPLSEHLPVDDLHTPYAISKYAAETYCKFYAEYYGLEVTTLRFFNSYGPHDPPGAYRNVLPNFILKGLRGDDLIITGTGKETRDFNFCENTTDAIVLAASRSHTANHNYSCFNVGTGVETTILDLAERVVSLTGGHSDIKILGKRRGWDKTIRRCACIEEISEKLGYVPRVTLDEGLPLTVAWLRDKWMNSNEHAAEHLGSTRAA